MKKLLALLLVLTMVLSLMVSCSQTATSTSTSTDATTSTTEPEQKELIKVKMAGKRTDDYFLQEEDPYLAELAAEAGLEIEWVDWAGTTIAEKRNLAFASGELPDAFYGRWVIEASDIPTYGADGFLLDLKPYMTEEYMPNFMNVVKDLPEMMSTTTAPDGSIYALYSYQELAYTDPADTFMINKNWLDAVGMDMPTTSDELFDVLMAFKNAGDLNGNGEKDEYAIGLEYNNGFCGALGLVGMTGLVYNSAATRVDIKDGQIVYVPATDEYKEYVTYMRKLYENGLLDPESFTMDDTTYKSKARGTTSIYGVISDWSAQEANNLQEGNDIAKDGTYQYISPITSSETGVTPVWSPRDLPPNRQPNFAINSNVDEATAIALLKFADLMLDPYNSMTGIYGIEGTHWEMVSDNQYKAIEKEPGVAYTYGEISEFTPAADALYVILRKNYADATEYGPQSRAAAGEVYKEYMDKEYLSPNAMKTAEESEALSLITADITSFCNMTIAKFITEGGIDEGWDDYIAGLEKLKLDEYVSIYQAIYERSL